jgi:hypothetical protein
MVVLRWPEKSCTEKVVARKNLVNVPDLGDSHLRKTSEIFLTLNKNVKYD